MPLIDCSPRAIAVAAAWELDSGLQSEISWRRPVGNPLNESTIMPVVKANQVTAVAWVILMASLSPMALAQPPTEFGVKTAKVLYQSALDWVAISERPPQRLMHSSIPNIEQGGLGRPAASSP